MTDYFLIGRIGKPKGLNGEVHLKFSIENGENYLDTETVFLEIGGKPVPFFVLSLRMQPGKNSAALRLEDVDHVSEARKLVGKSVYLPDAARVKLAIPIEGFQVRDSRLGVIGVIDKIDVYPQGQVAAIQYKNKEILIPLNEEFILRTDKQNKQLFVNLPEGLLEIYLE